ncbi:MAG TPA: hypothetical protein EYM97_06925 [Gemmatimonadetes bacterium]|nr:hypothetical protein [Gemmatimonadota bacterium]
MGIAEGFIHVRCIAAGAKGTLVVKAAGVEIHANLKASVEKGNIPDIDLRDELAGYHRHYWEGEHTLVIPCQHPALKERLGSPNDGFPGQNKPEGQVLLAEIVSAAICWEVVQKKHAKGEYNHESGMHKEPDYWRAKFEAEAAEFTHQAHDTMLGK